MGSAYRVGSTLPSYTVNSSPVTSTPFSVSVWFYPTRNPTTNGTCVANFSTTLSGSQYNGCYVNTSGLLVIQSTAGASVGTATSTNAVQFNRWNHLVFVFSSSSSRSVYLNGVLEATNTTSAANTNNRFRLFSQGINGFPTPMPLDLGSYVSELCIWSSALSAKSIFDLWSGCNPLALSGETLTKYFFARGRLRGFDDFLAPTTSYWATSTGLQFCNFEPPCLKLRERPYVGIITSITLVVDAATASSSITAPGLTLGGLSLSSPTITGTASAVASSYSIGALTLTTPTITAASENVVPSFVLGALTLSSPTITASSSVYQASIIPEALTLPMPVAESSSLVVDCSLSFSAVTLQVPTATATCTADSPGIFIVTPMPWDDGGLSLVTTSLTSDCGVSVDWSDVCSLVLVSKKACNLVQSSSSVSIVVDVNSGEVRSQR